MTIKLNSPLAPDLTKLSNYLSQVNESGWYTNFGPLHEKLTRRLETFLGVKNLLLVSNGTLALQVACKVLGIESAISTPFSFVATSSALMWQGIDVSYCDIDSKSYNLSPDALKAALEANSQVDGVVATHVYGNPCEVESFKEIAEQYKVKVLYDAAHAFGVKVGQESLLNFGDASTLSFHATKIFHTVEGGAIVFKRHEDYLCAKELINFGLQANGQLGEPGINAKLNEYQCAVGLTLLDQIGEVLEHRSHLFSLYRALLEPYVELPLWLPEASYNGSYMPIYIEDAAQQQTLLDALSKHDIQHRRYFTPSLDVAYPNRKSFGCPVSQKISEGAICLPLHANMTESELLTVVNVVKEVMS
ncbi:MULTISPECIES: DegT/DnrJ/EryC1/StrS family aminotransferase [Vibrio]|uniref:DegT/DnrJ/EryC1/StrS family aminotransferase n=1 Tax=Vibrio TaxID=662 RepID=UPI0011102C71|nr:MULTISPECIES: DegT/DnrJ/EryC1/StrS family aminotransferase [Vibrio]EJA7360285.1 DegT/DnrJ/EryC1/StrS family aminotransferase [Vibrio alginolyticus]MBO0198049.1 DegT/DnrJ/EryC1/StrS family aminotransferase [Vibrio alginolyticus]MCR9641850.1 DegT/DnrJ/EryC1/StrS family aminotransferase [Vibrio alginolyticus]MDW1579711.1 DegT/DnrJ/EryC1/StrS family aminotransferase [Vibrio sp. Vb2897]MDW1585866.1 DegT/DnrJ/EryC1/StrS family aminotransferase [Vibrio sp. Vb2910]